MFSFDNAAVQPLPLPVDESKIEVAIEPCVETEQVVLRYSTWTEGLGWCQQKTIRLDADQLEELQRSLTVARHRLQRQRAESGETRSPAKVIQLPTLA